MADVLPGDVLLVAGGPRDIPGLLIQAGERKRLYGWRAIFRPRPLPDPSAVNHAAVYVGDGWLVEALSGGLVRSPLTKYDPSQVLVARLGAVRPDVALEEREAACAFAEAQLARFDSYGWLSIASIVLQLVTPARLDISWDGALICSAFAAQCWEHAGVILPTRSSLTTMPSDLAVMVRG